MRIPADDTITIPIGQGLLTGVASLWSQNFATDAAIWELIAGSFIYQTIHPSRGITFEGEPLPDFAYGGTLTISVVLDPPDFQIGIIERVFWKKQNGEWFEANPH